MRSLLVRYIFPLLISLTELHSGSRVDRGRALGMFSIIEDSYPLNQSDKAVGNSNLAFYWGLGVDKHDHIHRDILHVNENQLASFSQRNFKSCSLDNPQKSLAWQCCWEALLIQDKLHRHKSAPNQAGSICMWRNEIIFYASCPVPETYWLTELCWTLAIICRSRSR